MTKITNVSNLHLDTILAMVDRCLLKLGYNKDCIRIDDHAYTDSGELIYESSSIHWTNRDVVSKARFIAEFNNISYPLNNAHSVANIYKFAKRLNQSNMPIRFEASNIVTDFFLTNDKYEIFHNSEGQKMIKLTDL